MTTSSSWPRDRPSPSPAPDQERPPGTSRARTCRFSKWKPRAGARTTKSCRATAQPAFWHYGVWTGSTRGFISAKIYWLKRLKKWPFLFQVSHIIDTRLWNAAWATLQVKSQRYILWPSSWSPLKPLMMKLGENLIWERAVHLHTSTFCRFPARPVTPHTLCHVYTSQNKQTAVQISLATFDPAIYFLRWG